MPIINVNLPSDGTGADVADYNGPINAILAVVNGHLAADNMEPGGLDWSVMSGSMSNVIPAAAMQDSGSVEKLRDEANMGFVASGLVWSALTGLNGTMTTGVYHSPTGARTTIGAITSRAFTASKDTYVSISPAGALTYTEVANGAARPSLTTDYRWLAKVVTSGVAITSVLDMRPINAPINQSNIDWNMFNNNMKSAVNTSTITPVNGSNIDGAAQGAAVTFTVSGNAMAFVIVRAGVVSTTDFENKPIIYLDGTPVDISGMSAAMGNGSSRVFERSTFTAIPLTNGSHTISGGINVTSATSPSIPAGNMKILAVVFGNVTA